MKLSELKFDGTDYYQDENISINNFYVYCKEEIHNILNLNNKNLFVNGKQYNICCYVTKNIYCYNYYVCHVFSREFRLPLLKIIVVDYKNYLRKLNLYEIIGA